MKFWWLLGLVLFLIVVMTFRESFTTYADALKDVGQTPGYTSLTGGTTGGSTTTTGVNATGGTTSGTTSGTPGPDPSCPSGFTIDSEKLTCKATTGVPPSCPSGYPVTASSSPTSVKCFQTTVNEGEFKIKECPTGTTKGEGGMCYGASQPSTCPSGFQLDRQQIHDGTGNIRTVGKCKAIGGTTGGTTTRATAGATGTTTGTTTAARGTTGGTTGSGVTPSTVKKSSLLGPVFTSYGAPITPGNPDSHKTNKYPELLGGGDPAARNRESGAGGGGFDFQGSLPTMDGLGATEASKYFPFSRQPGDMELIPDPYRVSQQFSSASYSFKTEPTPFLTDFSAFLR